jgi:hypothetical protein
MKFSPVSWYSSCLRVLKHRQYMFLLHCEKPICTTSLWLTINLFRDYLWLKDSITSNYCNEWWWGKYSKDDVILRKQQIAKSNPGNYRSEKFSIQALKFATMPPCWISMSIKWEGPSQSPSDSPSFDKVTEHWVWVASTPVVILEDSCSIFGPDTNYFVGRFRVFPFPTGTCRIVT